MAGAYMVSTVADGDVTQRFDANLADASQFIIDTHREIVNLGHTVKMFGIDHLIVGKVDGNQETEIIYTYEAKIG